ncbi:MAG: DUF2764 family protein [Bacteroidetes bacterium]|uniref:DUF2764 family protein n=1 Tax=Candidatus Cryptobacteroides faecipullorum TaxID=2840764 RepID=A0A9D9I8M1_9BACT|nr:DUF2764 family protein [Candidatus Cryptobacteroides faecipullorum]
MNNYHYIVAGLPVLSHDWNPGEHTPESIRAEILEQCSEKDRKTIGMLEKGFVDENLTEDFYRQALASRNRFVRDYFRFDLNVRNAKVRYLNEALGRDPKKDVIVLTEDDSRDEFEEVSKLDAVLHGKDILERERGIDDLMWDKIDEMTTYDYFDIEAILGFLAKLHIVERWYILDEKTGREMFRKLVDEVRGTFKGVRFDA